MTARSREVRPIRLLVYGLTAVLALHLLFAATRSRAADFSATDSTVAAVRDGLLFGCIPNLTFGSDMRELARKLQWPEMPPTQAAAHLDLSPGTVHVLEPGNAVIARRSDSSLCRIHVRRVRGDLLRASVDAWLIGPDKPFRKLDERFNDPQAGATTAAYKTNDFGGLTVLVTTRPDAPDGALQGVVTVGRLIGNLPAQ